MATFDQLQEGRVRDAEDLLERKDRTSSQLFKQSLRLSQEVFTNKHTTTILLCRLCESAGNQSKRFRGTIDLPLSNVGVLQAHLLAAGIRQHNVAAVWTSPLARARSTAFAIASASGLEAKMEPRLTERNLGKLQGQSHADVRAGFPHVWTAWKSYAPLPPEIKAEPEEEVIVRLESTFFELAFTYPGRTVAVVLHGANGRCLLKRSIGNASITTLEIQHGRAWSLKTLGDVSHLPPELAKDAIKASEL